MKKIFYTFLVFISLGACMSIVLAAEGDAQCSQTCRIADAPAPALTEYFKNIETIQGNILNGVSYSPGPLGSVSSAGNRVITSLSRTLSFREHYSSIDYFMAQRVTRDIPAAADRDYNRLQTMTKQLTDVLRRIEERGGGSSKVKNICARVENCSFTGNDQARYILTELIKNNNAIKQYYVAVVLGNTSLASDEDFILAAPDLPTQIYNYYNPEILYNCSSCAEEFGGKTTNQIQSISATNAYGQKGIQAWKDAWAILRGGKNSSENKEQQQIYATFLERQGLPQSKQDIISGNLQRYNSGGLSTSNPLGNTIDYTFSRFVDDSQSFGDALQESFGDNVSGDEIPFQSLIQVNTTLQGSQDVSQEIQDIYEMMQPFSLTEDTTTQSLQLRILNMHAKLIRSIDILRSQQRTSEKNCDKQGTEDGNCKY